MKNKRIMRKIEILSHELEYYKKVYPKCSKTKLIEERLNMYKKIAR